MKETGEKPARQLFCSLTSCVRADVCNEVPLVTKLPNTSVRPSRKCSRQAMVWRNADLAGAPIALQDSLNKVCVCRCGATAGSYSLCAGSSGGPFACVEASWMSTAGCGFASKLAASVQCCWHLSLSSGQMLWLQAVPAEQQQRITGALVDALADKDTGVSCDAAAALQSYGSNEQGMLKLQWQLSCLQSCDHHRQASFTLASSLCHHDCTSK